jgi:two-component system chemotaxis response regulator CheY
MKCLIVEDDAISSKIMVGMLSRHASSDVVINGQEAVELFMQAHESDRPYDLILMDIMMPGVNGLQAVLSIREKEASMDIPLGRRVKIVMTTALDDPRTVMKALYESDASSYLVKPIKLQKLEDELRLLKLI